MSERLKTALAWIGRAWLAFERLASRHYIRALVLFGVAVAVVVVWLGIPSRLIGGLLRILETINAPDTTSDELRQLTYAMGVTVTALAALVAAPLVLIRTYVAERQAQTAEEQRRIAEEQRRIAEQGHITDRFTKAVEQLGAEKTIKRTETVTNEETGDTRERVIEETVPNLEVRLGAIYALERIAQDSERDHIPIMETLCAYIRENAVARVDEEATAVSWAWDEDPEPPDVFYPPRADIQTALTVLGRRSEARLTYEKGKEYRLDLRSTSIPNADLTHARLGPAQFQGANLQRAVLEGANLQEAGLGGANLLRAVLRGANLLRAVLSGANLQRAVLGGAKLQGAELEGADLQEAGLDSANLQEAGLRGANLLRAWLRGANLQGARLRGANFESADLVLCSMALNSLRSVVLRGARNLSADSITSTFGVKRGVGLTVLPDGITPPDHWHDAGEGEKDTAEAQRAYQRAYEAWLKTQEVASKAGGDPA